MLAPTFALSTQLLFKQCGSLQTGSQDCTHVRFVKHISHRQWLSLCVSYFCLMMTFTSMFHPRHPPPPHKHIYTHTQTRAHIHAHPNTHSAVDQKDDWVPSLETAEQKGKWLTSGLSLSFLIELSQFFFFRVHCLLASPVTHLFIHALPPFSLSLSHALSPSASPVLCHSSPPALLSRHSPPSLFFSSSGDGDWQMIWQRKTSGEKKLTSPSRLTSTPRPPSALPPPLTAWGKLSFFI